jgi:hypothetical protein
MMAGVLGAAIIVVVLVVVIPVAVFLSAGLACGLLGHLAMKDAEARGDETWRQLNR